MPITPKRGPYSMPIYTQAASRNRNARSALWKYSLVGGAEHRRARLATGDPKAAVQIPNRRSKAHPVHCGMERGEPGRACR